MKTLQVFIGYDERETVAWHVLAHSIQRMSSVPVSITPLSLHQLKGQFHRERDPLQSNDFSFTRFLVPYLSNYEGISLFLDCDMLVMADILELFATFDPNKAVQVVKHNHKPSESIKYLGTQQTKYQRKNWSSVMLFHNERCKVLTPEYVKQASGLDLHQFQWIEDDLIGNLPHGWNHLVGYDPPHDSSNRVYNAHFTTGGPYFNEYRDVEFADEWRAEYSRLIDCHQLEV